MLNSVITIIRKMQLVNFMPKGSNIFGQHNRVRERIPRINNAFSKGMTITNSYNLGFIYLIFWSYP